MPLCSDFDEGTLFTDGDCDSHRSVPSSRISVNSEALAAELDRSWGFGRSSHAPDTYTHKQGKDKGHSPPHTLPTDKQSKHAKSLQASQAYSKHTMEWARLDDARRHKWRQNGRDEDESDADSVHADLLAQSVLLAKCEQVRHTKHVHTRIRTHTHSYLYRHSSRS